MERNCSYQNINNWQISLPVKNFRTSRGGSGALYSQSAIVRVMLAFDVWPDGLPFGSSDEVWVLRNMSL